MRQQRLFMASLGGGCGGAVRLCSTTSTSAPTPPSAPPTQDAQGAANEESAHASTSRTRSLEKSLWLTLHPVIKWTMLVDVARRAPYLLAKPVAMPGTRHTGPEASTAPLLARQDTQVHFSATSTAQHARLCAALPYPARLLLTLSLLLWLRALRDVQDTLSRVRLPYAPTQRFRHILVARVCPTRLQEYWCDHYTTVTARMNPLLNSTAEQVPAPHAWDPATSETVEDSATESTLVLSGHRHKGLLGAGGSRHRSALVRQIQGTTARLSDEDALAARVTGSRSLAGHQRRRLAVTRARERVRLGGVGTTAVESASHTPAPAQTDHVPSSAASGPREQWSRPDAQRLVPPVRMDTAFREDALYHHNDARGEGCPLSDLGALQATPIEVSVPDRPCHGPPQCEGLVRACVMAHAAILSSLFIEGRVVAFTTKDALVRDYVECVFEEWISERYVTVSLVEAIEARAATEPVVDAAPAARRPYFPAWCFKSALVVLPPRHRSAPSRRAAVVNMARVIVQAAPCAVMVPDSPCLDGTPPVHVMQLKEAVAALQEELAQTAKMSAEAAAAARRPGGWLCVEWVPVRPGATNRPGSASEAATTASASRPAETPAFRPKGVPATPPSSASDAGAPSTTTTGIHTLVSWLLPSRRSPPSGPTDTYLTAVAEALEGGEFYGTQLLYSAENSAYTSRQLRQWMLERLPANVRLVGVNTSPIDVLYFYPHVPFLTSKVGNSFRYRAVDRALVEKFGSGWAADPIRAALGRYSWARHGRSWERVGLHCGLALSDRAACVARENTHTAKKGVNDDADTEEADNALVYERTIEYLANPGKGTLLALMTAKILGV